MSAAYEALMSADRALLTARVQLRRDEQGAAFVARVQELSRELADVLCELESVAEGVAS